MLGRFYEREILSRILDRAMRDTADLRRELLAGARGRVLEIGVGTGVNLPFYPSGVDEIVAVDPAAGLLERARQLAHTAPGDVTFIEASASRPLPLADASFDAAVITFVLCSASRHAAPLLDEVRRLLRPGAPLLLAEHVLAPDPRTARVQRAIGPVWSTLLGGCNAAFDASAALHRAGFDPTHLRPVRLPFPYPVNPGLYGAVQLR